MSSAIGSITGSALADTLFAANQASSTTSADGTTSSSADASAKISILAKAIEDTVSIISGIVNPESVLGTQDTTYNFLLAAKSAGIMQAAPTFLKDVIAAENSGADTSGLNAVTMDTETLVSILKNSTP